MVYRTEIQCHRYILSKLGNAISHFQVLSLRDGDFQGDRDSSFERQSESSAFARRLIGMFSCAIDNSMYNTRILNIWVYLVVY